MKGKDGRKYIIEIKDEESGDAYFKLMNIRTGNVVDEGWLVASKNGLLRIERIK